MALINTPQDLEKWFEFHQKTKGDGKPYWLIYTNRNEAANGKGKCWLKAPEEDNYSSHNAKNDLIDAIALLPHGTRVLIRLRDKPEAKEASIQAETEYIHMDVAKAGSNIGGMGRGLTQEDIDRAVEKALAEAKKEQAYEAKLKLLEEKIEEAKATNWERILDHPTVKLAVPHVISGINNLFNPMKPETITAAVTASAVSGTQETDEQTRMENALVKLATADPNCLELLEKVADIAANKPANYNQYKPLILAS